MGAQAGKNLLLKIGDDASPTNFTTVAGLRAKTISLNAQTLDATNADSPGGWREYIGGAGVKSARLTGSGVFVDSAADAAAREAFFAQSKRPWRVIIPDFGEIEGPFLLTGLTYAGEYDGLAAYSLTLESAGELAFTTV